MRSEHAVGLPIRSGRPPKTVSPRPWRQRAAVWASSFASNTVTRIGPAVPLAAASSEVALTGTGDGPANPVVDGSVAGAVIYGSGGINDKGTYAHYRRVKGDIARIRSVNVGKKARSSS